MELDNELAKSFAMNDAGLTEEEAEDAVSDFVSNNDDGIKFCEDCGAVLNEDVNCKDEFLDDYCNDCWNKSLKEVKKLENSQL